MNSGVRNPATAASPKGQVALRPLAWAIVALLLLLPLTLILLEQQIAARGTRLLAVNLIDKTLLSAADEITHQRSAYSLLALNYRRQLEQMERGGAGQNEIASVLQGMLARPEPPLAAIIYSAPGKRILALPAALTASQPNTAETLLEGYYPSSALAERSDLVDFGTSVPELTRLDGTTLNAAWLGLPVATADPGATGRLIFLIDQRHLLQPLADLVKAFDGPGAARLYLRPAGEPARTIRCAPWCTLQPAGQDPALRGLLTDRPRLIHAVDNQQWQSAGQVVFSRSIASGAQPAGPPIELMMSLPQRQLAGVASAAGDYSHSGFFMARALLATSLVAFLMAVSIKRVRQLAMTIVSLAEADSQSSKTSPLRNLLLDLSPVEQAVTNLKTRIVENVDLLRRVQQGEGSYTAMMEASLNGILLVNDTGRILKANRSICQLSGYTREELIGQPIDLLTPEQYRNRQLNLREAHHRELITGQYPDVALRTASGEEIEVKVILSSFEINNLPHVLVVVRDVRAERAAEQERERLTLLAEYTTDHVLITDLQTRIVWANAAYYRFVNRSKEQILGQSALERLHLDGADDEPLQRLRKAYQTGQNEALELSLADPSGQLHWLEITLHAVEHYAVFVGRDVTARRRAAEERELLTLVAEYTRDMVLITDPQLQAIWANAAFYQFTGHRKEQIAGQSATTLLHFSNADEAAVQRFADACQAKQAATIELSVDDPRGGRFWMEIAINPVENHMVLVASDVTARIQAAAQLVDANRRLERRVSERTRELTLAKEHAESANRAKSAFLATMSHEIRTPLHGVIASVDLLAREQMDDMQRSHLRRIEQSADNLAHTLDGVLDFSRIEAGQFELESEPLLLRTVLEGTANALHPLAKEKGVLLVVDVDPELDASAVFGDSPRLAQVVNNLLGNAIKFSVGQPQPRVVLRAQLVERDETHLFVTLTVADNGIGMTAAQAKKIFEPFTQAQSDITRRYGGTGLGLAITQGLLAAMGGDIEVSSALGSGATFTAHLRLAICAEIAPPAYPQLPAARLLILAGGDELEEVLQRYLTFAGAELDLCEQRSVPALRQQLDAATLAGTPYQAVLVCDQSPGLLTQLIQTVAAGASYPPLLFIEDHGDRLSRDLPGAIIRRPIERLALLEQVAAAIGLTVAPGVPRAAPDTSLVKGKGELILAVEDNPLNQEVIAEQLRQLGYRYIIAVDGLQALQEFDQHEFSAVLTDCHMPRMDGYELTMEIRRREAGITPAPHIPIIAVTADINAEERRRCSRAGMDSWLTKPVVLSTLSELLARWISATPTPRSDTPPLRPDSKTGNAKSGAQPEIGDDAQRISVAPPPARSADTAVGVPPAAPLNIEALVDLIGDDPQLQAHFLEKFLQGAPPIIAAMLAAAQTGDLAAAAGQAHKLKSSARYVGAYELAAACDSLEAAGKAGDVVRLQPAAAEVQAAFDRVLQYAATEYPTAKDVGARS